MNKLRELRQERARLVGELRSFVDTHESDWTDERQQEYARRFAEIETINAKIEALEKLEEEERRLTEVSTETRREKPEGQEKPSGEYRDGRGAAITKEQSAKLERDFEAFLRTGNASAELRALEAGADTQGGYLVPTQAMSARLLKNVDDAVFIRRFAAVERQAQAESLGIPSLTDPDDFDWTTELATGALDTTMAFGKRELRPHPLAKRIKVSKKLLRSSVRDVVSLVGERFGYKIGVTEERAFLTGNGGQRPLGVFVASTNGISTGRDVATDNTTTAITADGLMSAKYALKSQYWSSARWLFHRDGVRNVAKLKDGDGRYLFDLNTNQLLGFPVDTSEFAPNTFTTGQYVGLLASWAQGYTIVEALSMEMQRLDELYAETNQVGFIWRREVDGAPVLEEAFVRVTLA